MCIITINNVIKIFVKSNCCYLASISCSYRSFFCKIKACCLSFRLCFFKNKNYLIFAFSLSCTVYTVLNQQKRNQKQNHKNVGHHHATPRHTIAITKQFNFLSCKNSLLATLRLFIIFCITVLLQFLLYNKYIK